MTSYWQDPNLKLYFNSSADHQKIMFLICKVI